MTDVVIAAAARTPVGSFLGALSTVAAHTLGEVAIVEALSRAGVEPGEVDEVIMGQILSAGQGQNPARQAAIGAGIPVEKTAYGINQLCGSGLRSVALGMQAIKLGDSSIVVAGCVSGSVLTKAPAMGEASTKLVTLPSIVPVARSHAMVAVTVCWLSTETAAGVQLRNPSAVAPTTKMPTGTSGMVKVPFSPVATV